MTSTKKLPILQTLFQKHPWFLCRKSNHINYLSHFCLYAPKKARNGHWLKCPLGILSLNKQTNKQWRVLNTPGPFASEMSPKSGSGLVALQERGPFVPTVGRPNASQRFPHQPCWGDTQAGDRRSFVMGWIANPSGEKARNKENCLKQEEYSRDPSIPWKRWQAHSFIW